MGTISTLTVKLEIQENTEKAFEELIQFKYSDKSPSEFNWKYFVTPGVKDLIEHDHATFLLLYDQAKLEDGIFYFASDNFKNYYNSVKHFLVALAPLCKNGMVVVFDDVNDGTSTFTSKGGKWEFDYVENVNHDAKWKQYNLSIKEWFGVEYE